MKDENSQYLVSSSGAVCERLPLDSRFAKRMVRGGMGDPNYYVTTEQATMLKRYIPAAMWSKDERVVYNTMQNYIDNTGLAPTVAQIAAMAQRSSLKGSNGDGGVQSGGLTAKRVQRALDKLRQRGIVFEAA